MHNSRSSEESSSSVAIFGKENVMRTLEPQNGLPGKTPTGLAYAGQKLTINVI
jgi:hypothetical protein